MLKGETHTLEKEHVWEMKRKAIRRCRVYIREKVCVFFLMHNSRRIGREDKLMRDFRQLWHKSVGATLEKASMNDVRTISVHLMYAYT